MLIELIFFSFLLHSSKQLNRFLSLCLSISHYLSLYISLLFFNVLIAWNFWCCENCRKSSLYLGTVTLSAIFTKKKVRWIDALFFMKLTFSIYYIFIIILKTLGLGHILVEIMLFVFFIALILFFFRFYFYFFPLFVIFIT